MPKQFLPTQRSSSLVHLPSFSKIIFEIRLLPLVSNQVVSSVGSIIQRIGGSHGRAPFHFLPMSPLRTSCAMASQDVDQRILPIEESIPMYKSSRPSSSHPGDGVCPSTAQFENAARVGYELWSPLGWDSSDDSSLPATAGCLLDLLRHIPAFYARTSKAFSIVDAPFPQIKYSLEWTTTTDATCDQPVKRTRHYLTIEIPEPVGYKSIDTSEACPYWPGIGADRAHYLSYLIFGWTYILSCRWAEILQDSGEEVLFRQSEELDHRNFWEVMAGPRWQAILVRDGDTFHAPWSLKASDAAPQYAQKLSVA